MPPRPTPPTPAARVAASRGREGARWLASAAVALAMSAPAVEARAASACQSANGLSTCIDADNLWPHAGGGPFLAVGSTETTPEGSLSFGIVASLSSRPIGLRVSSPSPDGTVIHPLGDVLDGTLVLGFGVTDRLMLTFAAPVTFYQNGVGASAAVGVNEPVEHNAIRDLRFGLAYAIVGHERLAPGTGVTARLELSAPTATPGVFAGGATMVASPGVTVDHRIGRVDIAAEVGGRIRGDTRLARSKMASQLYGALGVSVDVLRDGWLSVGAEAFALYTLAAQPAGSSDAANQNGSPLVPAEWLTSVTSTPLLAGDLGFTLAGGGPLVLDPSLTTPRYRFDLAVRYAPSGKHRPAPTPPPENNR